MFCLIALYGLVIYVVDVLHGLYLVVFFIDFGL